MSFSFCHGTDEDINGRDMAEGGSASMDTSHIPPPACEPAFKRPKTQQYQHDPSQHAFQPIEASSAISIRLVDPDAGLGGPDAAQCRTTEVCTFNPELTHQVFGHEEEINGYKGLQVVVQLDANSFYSQATVTYEDSLDGADDVAGKLTDALQPGLLESVEAFEAKLREPEGNWLDIDDLGCVVDQHSWQQGELILSYDVLSKASPKLKELHARLEAFMTFFIDGFERIDSEDPNWEIYVASYQAKSSLRVVGFAVVYNLLAFPKGRRKKVGQIFVMPNHQGARVGTKILKAVHKVAENVDVVDVTLVDPSPSMRAVRDKWDIERMVTCQWIRQLASQTMELKNEKRGAKISDGCGEDRNTDPEKISRKTDGSTHNLALCVEHQHRLQSSLKISKTQALLLWEGLLMVEAKADPDLIALVRDFVECRMVNIWGAGAVSNKVILQTKNDDGSSRDDFIMLRCRNIPPIQEAMRQGLILMPTEVCLEEEKKLQISSEVDQRMEELTNLAVKYWQ